MVVCSLFTQTSYSGLQSYILRQYLHFHISKQPSKSYILRFLHLFELPAKQNEGKHQFLIKIITFSIKIKPVREHKLQLLKHLNSIILLCTFEKNPFSRFKEEDFLKIYMI